MNGLNKYTEPRLVKGKKPIKIPKGSSLEKEWAKNIWYINYSFNGKQYRIKGDLNRIKDYKEKGYKGEVLLQSIKDDLKNSFDPSNPEAFFAHIIQENITLADAVEKYLDELKTYARPKTVESYRSKLHHLNESFPNKQVKSFKPIDLEKYIHGKIHNKNPAKIFINNNSIDLSKPIPWTPNTVRTGKGIFRAFFQWCIRNNYYNGDNPATKIESKKIRSEVVPKQRHVPFTKVDLVKVMDYLDKKDKLISFFCRFIYSTCLRPGEISKLKINDIGLDKMQILIPMAITKNTKKNSVEIIPIEPNFQNELKKLELNKYPKDYFITSNSETIIGEKCLSSNNAYKRFIRALKSLELENKGYTLYSFKHFSNIQRYNSGWKLLDIMKANRHSSISMTEKYLKDINHDTDISNKEVPII